MDIDELKEKDYEVSVSGREFQVVEFIVETGKAVFTASDLANGLGWEREKVHRIVSSMKGKGLIETPVRGKHVPDLPGHTVTTEAVATELYWPSYITFWTALSYHDLTDQMVDTLYVANTDRSGKIRFRDRTIRFVDLNPDYLFGYERNDGTIAEPEKAVIDSLHLPRYSGGIREIEKAVTRDLDIEKLEQYADRMGIDAVKKRLKYLLDRNNVPNTIDVGGSYVDLEPGAGEGKLVKECRVRDNVYDN